MQTDLLLDGQLSSGLFELRVKLQWSGRALAVVGPNGAGKSTLLRALVGGPVQVRGRLSVGGEVWVDTTTGRWVPPEHRRVGWVGQHAPLFPHLSVHRNVAWGPSASVERGQTYMQRLRVDHLAGRRPAHLSGGERQRVALARALAREPGLLVLDEPNASQDARARHWVREALRGALSQGGHRLVLATHDLDDVLALNADVLLVEGGGVRMLQPGDGNAGAPEGSFLAALHAARVARSSHG